MKKLKLVKIDGLKPVLDLVPSISIIEGRNGEIKREETKLQNQKGPFKELVDLENVDWDKVMSHLEKYLEKYLKRYHKDIYLEIDKKELKRIVDDGVLIHTPYYNKEEKSKYATDYTIEMLLNYIKAFLKHQKKNNGK